MKARMHLLFAGSCFPPVTARIPLDGSAENLRSTAGYSESWRIRDHRTGVTNQGNYTNRPMLWEDEPPAQSRVRRMQTAAADSPLPGRVRRGGPGMPLEMDDPDMDDDAPRRSAPLRAVNASRPLVEARQHHGTRLPSALRSRNSGSLHRRGPRFPHLARARPALPHRRRGRHSGLGPDRGEPQRDAAGLRRGQSAATYFSFRSMRAASSSNRFPGSSAPR